MQSSGLENAVEPRLSDPAKEDVMLHVFWGHASARQLTRSLVDSDGGAVGCFGSADAVLQPCEVCGAFDKAPHLPAADTSSASPPNAKLRSDLLFLDDTMAPRAMDVYPRYPLAAPFHP